MSSENQALARQCIEIYGTVQGSNLPNILEKTEQELLATNQAVGGSNPSGRAKQEKAPLAGAFFVCLAESLRTCVARRATGSSRGGRQPDDAPSAARPSFRARQTRKAPPCEGPFCL